jgi:predicted ester cyclase
MFASAFPDFRYQVEDVIAEADKVAVRDVFRGTHQGDFMGVPATGNRVTMEAIHTYRFSEGKLAEHWVARDDLGMMRQLGVVPAPGRSA